MTQLTVLNLKSMTLALEAIASLTKLTRMTVLNLESTT